MDAGLYIRRHINSLTDGKPFSIRDFLGYGSRNVVDQIFHRLVESGRIVRVARGVYTKPDFAFPSAAEVAEIKAAAFGKIIVMHGEEAACKLGIAGQDYADQNCAHNEKRFVFACSGRSSSFSFGTNRIYFIGTCARKMHLGNETVGLVSRSLWHLGKALCNYETISIAIAKFNRTDRQQLRQSMKIMPGWMLDQFAFIRR